MNFKPLTGVNYKFNYEDIFRDIVNGALPKEPTFAELIKGDLWFLLYFVMGYKEANHSFVIQACRDLEDGANDYTLDLWARGHYKSSIITKAETIQEILKNPEERIGLFSHTRPAAKSFLREIKSVFQFNETLKECFPNILYKNPEAEAPKWSEDDGLVVKRKGTYAESTVEAWGLLEGMPTGKHFTIRKYDDIETKDLVSNPDTVARLKDAFSISQNLKSQGGRHRVIGTPYHHAGLLQYLRELKDIHGVPMYFVRLKTATDDGSPNGKPIFLSQNELDKLKVDEQSFYSQQLLDPTPRGVRRLNSGFIKEIAVDKIPLGVYKFMVIDPAGESNNGDGDSWAIHVVGVAPVADEIGASNIYIIDSFISPLTFSQAIDQICRMYLANGMILRVGVEKAGISTTEIHVANALLARGRYISTENNSLVVLSPAGRNKEDRIESALSWALNNGKIHISTNIPLSTRNRLKAEMDKFPYWHDDGIDALAYIYDMFKDFRFKSTQAYEIPEYEPCTEAVGY